MGLNSNPKAGVRCVPARKPKKGGTTGLRPGFPAFDGSSVTVIRWFIVFKVPKHRDIIVTANIVIIVTLSSFQFCFAVVVIGTSIGLLDKDLFSPKSARPAFLAV